MKLFYLSMGFIFFIVVSLAILFTLFNPFTQTIDKQTSFTDLEKQFLERGVLVQESFFEEPLLPRVLPHRITFLNESIFNEMVLVFEYPKEYTSQMTLEQFQEEYYTVYFQKYFPFDSSISLFLRDNLVVLYTGSSQEVIFILSSLYGPMRLPFEYTPDLFKRCFVRGGIVVKDGSVVRCTDFSGSVFSLDTTLFVPFDFETCSLVSPILESYPEQCIYKNTTFIRGARETYTEFYSGGFYTGNEFAFYEVIRDLDTYTSLMNTLYSDELLERARILAPDFNRSLFVVLGTGLRPSGGYALRASDIVSYPDSLVIKVIEAVPDKTCFTIQTVTYPILVLELDQTEKPIRIIVESAPYSCEV